MDIDRMVVDWCERDHRRALLPIDHDVVDATRALRQLLLASVTTRRPDRDTWSAFALFGRMLADRGGSPTLAASTIDGLRDTLGDPHASWIPAARAALAEGFAAARAEQARVEAAASWEYPRCAVPLDDGAVAIAAGYPDTESDALEEWAGRVANGVALSGARRAVVAGDTRAREALVDALTLAGVKVEGTAKPPHKAWRFFRR